MLVLGLDVLHNLGTHAVLVAAWLVGGLMGQRRA